MKLLPKLLLGIGCLLLLMIIVLSLFPIFFIRKDVQKTTKEIEVLLEKDREEFIKSNQQWLAYELNDAENNLSHLMSMLSLDQALINKLAFTPDNSLMNSWKALGHIAGFSPEIGFLQLYSPEERKAAIIFPHEVSLYSISDHFQEKEALTLLLRAPHTGELKKTTYTIIPLPIEDTSSFKFYALVKPKPVIKPSIEKAQQIIQEGRWDLKIEMIQTLIPLYVERLTVDGIKVEVEGLARVDANGKGVAILSEEAFATTPLVDNLLTQKTMVLAHPKVNHVYLTRSLGFDSNFLTIAYPIGILAKRLALFSKTSLLMHINKQYWFGYNEKGEPLSKSEVDLILTEGVVQKESSKMTENSSEYVLSPIGAFFGGNLSFFGIYSLQSQLSVINALKNFEDDLAERISLQLALVSLIIMIGILLFAIRFAMSVIYPVKKLAQATPSVVSGRYEEIVFPNIGKRKDEVAVLAQSFAEMVKGLQEREKIRAVLNKVVSKDVAEEILKTQIHLGGEDRVVSMLFADIREFTQLTRELSPQKTIEMLNLCMTKISHVIEGEGGVIDKYVGDEVMALFGAPTSYPDHALRAISTAMLIIETLKKWNQEREAGGKRVVEMGIGVHTGLVVAGNMGAENRLNYTVLGTNVNIAARLCQVAKSYQLIISQKTLEEPGIKDSFHVRSLPALILKGFVEPIQIYEVLGFKWESST